MRGFSFAMMCLLPCLSFAQSIGSPYGLDVRESELRFMFGVHSQAVDLELGRHGPADYVRAAAVYRKAAVLGLPLAQNNLARLYDTVPAQWPRWVFSDGVATRLRPPMHGDSSGVRGAAFLWPPTAARG